MLGKSCTLLVALGEPEEIDRIRMSYLADADKGDIRKSVAGISRTI